MNKRARSFLLVVVVFGGAVWLSGSLVAVENAAASRTVVVDKSHVVLTGTELAKADQDAMNKILSHYNKALYRIDTYEKGKLKKSQGSMTNVVTDKRLASEIATNVKKAGYTHFAVQICTGSTTNPATSTNPAATTPKPGSTTNPARNDPGNTTNPLSTTNNQNTETKCRELVERLKPILEKYRRK